MHPLPNGCFRSPITVHPKNWESAKPSVTKSWHIGCRFYDPDRGVKQILIRSMNKFKGSAERQDATRVLLLDLNQRLEIEGYNPITDTCIPPVETNEYDIGPHTTLKRSLEIAYTRLDIGNDAKELIGYAMAHFKKALEDLRYSNIPVGTIEPKHILFLLDKVGENKIRAAALSDKPPREGSVPWSASNYNHHRSYLMMLFKKLVPLGAVKVNPVRELELKKMIKKKKVTFNADERKAVGKLMEDEYTFWRFIQIFFHSGARIAELMRVKKEHVNLHTQIIDTVIYKGRQYTEEDKVIKDIVLPLWQELMSEAKPGDFLFAKSLCPGPVKISARQITIRWRRVRKGLGITKTIYKLKHTHSTEIMDILVNVFKDAREKVAMHNNQKSTDMVVKVYDVESDARENAEIRKIGNAL